MVTRFIALSCFVAVSLACPPIDLPRFSSMNCTWVNPKVKQCRFECQSGIEMIGSSVLTCKKRAKKWDNEIPICFSDFATCGKKYCPIPKKAELKKFTAHRNELTSDQLDAIRKSREAYRSMKMSRSNSKISCFEWMCRIRCPFLTPNRYMIKHCQKCKRKKIIKCSRAGTLFG